MISQIVKLAASICFEWAGFAHSKEIEAAKFK